MKKGINLFLVCVLILLTFYGCGSKDEVDYNDNLFTIYFLDLEKCALSSQPLEIDQNDITIEDLVGYIQEACEATLPNSEKVIAGKVTDTIIDSDNVTVCFQENFDTLKESEQLLMIASYVLTLTQHEDISSVKFLKGNIPINLEKKKENKEDEENKESEEGEESTEATFSVLKASDFTNNIGEGTLLYTMESIKYYFADQTGENLIPYTEEIRLGGNQSKELCIVTRIIEGPKDERYRAVVDPSTKVISVTTKDNICYVNLDETFLLGTIGIEPKTTVYAIVNSLTELTHISAVQFSINGKTTDKFGNIEFKDILIRKLDLKESEGDN